MEWVVTTAKTVEQAVDVALDQLGVAESDAEFEILEEPKGGLFGLGSKQARVRARVRPKKPPAKDERNERRNRRSRNGGAARSSSGSMSGESTRTPTRDAGESTEATEGDERSAPKRRRRGGKGRSGSGADRSERSESAGGRTDAIPNPRSAGGKKENAAMLDELTLDQQSEKAQEFLKGLVEAFGVTATVNTKINHDDAIVELSVDGDELGLMVGAKGSTLQAVQDLTRTVLQRTAQNLDGLVVVDIASYRAKRREALQKFAAKVHQEVVDNAKQVVLEPMNASDRKVVHDALGDLGGVATHSEGEEPRRRVVVSPLSQD